MDMYVGFMVLEGILAVAVIAINLLVCITIYIHKELRSTTNYLIVCLAVADLGVGTLAIPFSMVLSMDYILCFYACLFLTCFPLVTTQFSVLLLLVIAINAHLKIRLPNSYAMYVKKGWNVVTVVICWLLSLLIGLSPMMGWNRLQQFVNANKTVPDTFPSEGAALVILSNDMPFGGFLSKLHLGRQNLNYTEIHKGHIGLCSFTSVFSPKYMICFIFFICTLLALIAMLAIYADLFRIVRGHFQSQALWPTKKKEIQLARTLFLLVGVFCVCWMPLQVNCLVQLLCPSCERYESLDHLAVLLSHLNSLANPLVYALRKKDVGLALQAVFLERVLHWPWLKTCCHHSAKVYPQA